MEFLRGNLVRFALTQDEESLKGSNGWASGCDNHEPTARIVGNLQNFKFLQVTLRF